MVEAGGVEIPPLLTPRKLQIPHSNRTGQFRRFKNCGHNLGTVDRHAGRWPAKLTPPALPDQDFTFPITAFIREVASGTLSSAHILYGCFDKSEIDASASRINLGVFGNGRSCILVRWKGNQRVFQDGADACGDGGHRSRSVTRRAWRYSKGCCRPFRGGRKRYFAVRIP